MLVCLIVWRMRIQITNGVQTSSNNLYIGCVRGDVEVSSVNGRQQLLPLLLLLLFRLLLLLLLLFHRHLRDIWKKSKKSNYVSNEEATFVGMKSRHE